MKKSKNVKPDVVRRIEDIRDELTRRLLSGVSAYSVHSQEAVKARQATWISS